METDRKKLLDVICMYRIGIDAHMLEDCSGGNEVFYENILQNMEVPDDLVLYLFVRQGIDVDLYSDKFEIIYLKSRNAFTRYLIELPLLCLKLRLDMLHVQYFIPFIRPCKVMTTIHDISFEHSNDFFTKKDMFFQRHLIPYAVKKSKKIVTVSNYVKKDICKTYGCNEDKIVVTYNATSNIFRPMSEDEINKKELLNKYGISGDDFILCVCNIQPRKNLRHLIDAYTILKNTGRPEKLVLVGKRAWMYEEIDMCIEKMPDDIYMTGYISKEDLVRFYNACSLFVYPSLTEGFGIPPLEAMACGAKVIVSDVEPMGEILGDNIETFNPVNIYSISNACISALDSNEKKEARIGRYKMKISLFSWKKSAEVILGEYKKIVTNEK